MVSPQSTTAIALASVESGADGHAQLLGSAGDGTRRSFGGAAFAVRTFDRAVGGHDDEVRVVEGGRHVPLELSRCGTGRRDRRQE